MGEGSAQEWRANELNVGYRKEQPIRRIQMKFKHERKLRQE